MPVKRGFKKAKESVERFHTEYLCEIMQTPDFDELVDLWTKFYVSTELFDRSVCAPYAPKVNNRVQPQGYKEHAVCQKHAYELRKRLDLKARCWEVPLNIWKSAQFEGQRLADIKIKNMEAQHACTG